MTADAEALAEALPLLREVLRRMKALREETGSFVDAVESTRKDFVPLSVVQLLERLTYLLGLSDLEREFFTACASDEIMDAWDARLAYADWLQERGDEAAGLRVRKLTPQPGDVLVHHAPPSTSTQEDLELHVAPARALAEALAARGVETIFAVIPPGGSIARLSEEQMAAAGWVRATGRPGPRAGG